MTGNPVIEPSLVSIVIVAHNNWPDLELAIESALCQSWPNIEVLVVDNEESARIGLQRLLEGWGCEVHAAGDGDSAHASLHTNASDLWLLDYHLDDNDTGVGRKAVQFVEEEGAVTIVDE